jgi:hypothetical protein
MDEGNIFIPIPVRPRTYNDYPVEFQSHKDSAVFIPSCSTLYHYLAQNALDISLAPGSRFDQEDARSQFLPCVLLVIPLTRYNTCYLRETGKQMRSQHELGVQSAVALAD